MEKINLKDINEFLVGQAEDKEAMTGCTVIISKEGAVTAVDVRGGSPGTRDTDALDPICNREVVHSVVLSGGSSFGLDAACGVSEFLEEKGIGRNVGVTYIPNVCEAVLFDLCLGRSDVRPDKEMGKRACENAFNGEEFKSGNHGAGTGASIGKALGNDHAMKGGIGICGYKEKDLYTIAIYAVNCVGDIVEDGNIIAGARNEDNSFANSEEVILKNYQEDKDLFKGNTVIGCILTNAKLTKAKAKRLASKGHNAIARVIYPAHSIHDGDSVFAMCSCKVEASEDAIGILAAKASKDAILDAIKSAESYKEYIAYKDISK